MTKEDEKLIADAIVKIAKHAEVMHPTEAAIKVAREKNLTPGRIKIVCAAFNQGQQSVSYTHLTLPTIYSV